jgi:hypothetical protein
MLLYKKKIDRLDFSKKRNTMLKEFIKNSLNAYTIRDLIINEDGTLEFKKSVKVYTKQINLNKLWKGKFYLEDSNEIDEAYLCLEIIIGDEEEQNEKQIENHEENN